MNSSELAIIMFLLIVVGYVSRKTGMVKEGFAGGLASFIFNFVFPAIIIRSMNIPYIAADIINSGILIVVCIVTMVVMLMLSWIMNCKRGFKDNFAKIFIFSMMFPNFTFMAFPVMEALFPEKGLFYITMYTIPTRVIIYILGPFIIGRALVGKTKKEIITSGLKSLITPPVLAIPLGFAVYLTGISLPIPINSTLDYLAKVATPMGMALTGMMLAEVPVRSIISDKKLYFLSFVRLLLAPILTAGMLLLFMYNGLYEIAIDPIVFKICVIYSALPAASSTTIFAVTHNGDASTAAGSVFMTTAFSVITVPLIVWITSFMV